MIDEETGWASGEFFAHVTHGFVFRFAGWVATNAKPREEVKPFALAKIGRKRVDDSRFAAHFANANLTKWKNSVSDRAPDKHGDAAKDTSKNDSCNHGFVPPVSYLIISHWLSGKEGKGKKLKAVEILRH